MSDAVETIRHADRELAIVVRAEFSVEGITFLTPGHFSQQLGFMSRPTGYRVAAHRHRPVDRAVTTTLETLFVRRGRVRIDFYDDDRTLVSSTELRTGDVALLIAGGHGLTMLEPTEIVEVKQGPYAGDQDKVVFESELP